MRVVVLAGGTSTERAVSIISGKEVYRSLKRRGYQVILLDVSFGFIMKKNNRECHEKNKYSELFNQEIDWEQVIDDNTGDGYTQNIDKNNSCYFGPNVLSICKEADIVFIALHGENGENGKLQACFDLLGIKYTGTDYISSALAMDKGITKDIFNSNGILTPEGFRLAKAEYKENYIVEKMKSNKILNFPVVVKATCGGSSIGVYIVDSLTELLHAASETFKYGDEIIIERYIPGREFSVGVIEGNALPIVEIKPKEGFYDYTNKYKAGATDETCPAILDEIVTEGMKKVAERAFSTLRLKKYARFDFRMENTTGKIYCLEGNTLPGMTPTSLIPLEAKAAGIVFDDLCEIILHLSSDKQ